MYTVKRTTTPVKMIATIVGEIAEARLSVSIAPVAGRAEQHQREAAEAARRVRPDTPSRAPGKEAAQVQAGSNRKLPVFGRL